MLSRLPPHLASEKVPETCSQMRQLIYEHRYDAVISCLQPVVENPSSSIGIRIGLALTLHGRPKHLTRRYGYLRKLSRAGWLRHTYVRYCEVLFSGYRFISGMCRPGSAPNHLIQRMDGTPRSPVLSRKMQPTHWVRSPRTRRVPDFCGSGSRENICRSWQCRRLVGEPGRRRVRCRD